MKRIFLLAFLTISLALKANTLFSPGTITIGTNQAMLINSTAGQGTNYVNYPTVFADGIPIGFSGSSPFVFVQGQVSIKPKKFAIAGPHSIYFSNDANCYISYQLINSSAIQTIFQTNADVGQTNTLIVPAGKTIQFFAPIPVASIYLGVNPCTISPDGSTNSYPLFDQSFSEPSITGPATITLISSGGVPALYSYYFTDQILQLPAQGFLNVPAPQLEVNIQKSYNLTDWTNVGAFNTSAEAGAFYRLKILQ